MAEPIDLNVARWLIKELQNGDRHIIGLVCGEGRVSSPIVSFDKDTMTFTTTTGRRYHARRGGSAINIAAAYVWDSWCHINSVYAARDVTEEYDPEEDV